MSEEPYLQTRGLSKRFRRRMALDGVELAVRQGQTILLYGPNGAGKSTLINILSTLMRPTAGEISLRGKPLFDEAETLRAELGMLTPHPMLYADLTARENLRFYARLYGVPEADARIGELLGVMGLGTRADEVIRNFSFGMTQRASAARALLHRPRLLLLDEPFTGLDRDGTATLVRLLAEQSADGVTILLATHQVPDGLTFADRVVVIDRGKLTVDRPVGDGEPPRPEDLLGAPR